MNYHFSYSNFLKMFHGNCEWLQSRPTASNIAFNTSLTKLNIGNIFQTKNNNQFIITTVGAEIFVRVLFSRILSKLTSRKLPLQCLSKIILRTWAKLRNEQPGNCRASPKPWKNNYAWKISASTVSLCYKTATAASQRPMGIFPMSIQVSVCGL